MTYSDDETRYSQMMLAAQAGDAAVYETLLAELTHVLERYLQSRFGHADFLQDCAQDCLMAVHQARHTYQAGRPFRAWLFAIARHKAIDHLRRQRTRDAWRETATVEQNYADPTDSELSQGDLFRQLSPSHSQALILTKIIGLSTKEAAQQCSVSEAAMKLRVYRAIRAARRVLEEESYG